jgi:hypothetical protein
MATIDATEARLTTHEEMLAALKEYLYYDPDTGEFSCIKPSGKRKAGQKVGTKNNGYLQIGFGGFRDRAHRLAWLYVHGVMPTEIDHINGNRMDNRLCNLRNVSHKLNSQNVRKPPSHNSTGFLGVSYFKASKKYSSYITIDGKKKHLGYFHNPDEAHQVYLQAKRKAHTSCTI